nr:M23 family metallopeptidase [Actinomycetota bacterium]
MLAVFALAGPPVACAWSWPATGEVLRPFDYGGGTYTAEGHRGIDIAGEPGAPVLAPAAGRVSFAGTIAANGKTISVRTGDGWVVTLTHLGSITVSVGDGVAEREPIGTIGPAGDAEVEEPYVQLGIRRVDDPRGYVDPLTLLPQREAA